MQLTGIKGATGAMVASLVIMAAANAAPISGQGTWETTLQGRDLDGNASTFEAYYDTVLDITWAADANINGADTWAKQNTWAAGLSIGGVTGWRLPSMIDTAASGCDYSVTGGTDCGFNVQTGSAVTTVYSEMASLWMNTLGNLPWYDTAGNSDQPGWGLTNTGPFSNIQSDSYWTGLEYTSNTNTAWDFYTYLGSQSKSFMFDGHYGWAVLSGDVSAVPVPGAVWLLGSGLMVLVGFSKRKR